MTARRLIAVVFVLLAACGDDVSHENLDKWMQTEKGPGKLKEAVANADLDPDLSAHAAENLLIIREDAAVREAVPRLSEERRARVLEKLAPRLWRLARIEGELTAPNEQQIAAKDLLFDLREHAAGPVRATIDQYLVDWYTGGYYKGRAGVGRWTGAQVMRAIGEAAGPGMVKAANAVIGAPKQDGKRVRVDDELLLGLAVTGHPEAVKYVVDVVQLDRGDDTLAERALDALYQAFVEPPAQLFERVPGAALVPHVPALTTIAHDEDSSNPMVNDAVSLIAAAGPPHCVAPLVAMIDRPNADPRYLWVGANNALRCGGADAIVDVVRAMPTGGSYEHEALQGAVIGEIARMSPPAQVVGAARELLDEKSWVARWVGAEVLAAVGSKEDKARIEALRKDRTRLHGYWGDQSELPKAERKAEPTLGERAAELAAKL